MPTASGPVKRFFKLMALKLLWTSSKAKKLLDYALGSAMKTHC